MRYSDHLIRELFPEAFVREDNPRDKLDLDRWTPSEADTFKASRFFLDLYTCTLEEADEELAQPYLDVYRKIQRKGISACKDEIQGELCEMFWAVDGDIEEYYKGADDILEMMNLTILKEPVAT